RIARLRSDLAVDENDQRPERLALCQVGLDHLLPLLAFRAWARSEAIAGQISESNRVLRPAGAGAGFLRDPQVEEVDQPRPARRARDARQLPPAGESIQGTGLAHVAAPAEGDLRWLRRGIPARLGRALDEVCGEDDHKPSS